MFYLHLSLSTLRTCLVTVFFGCLHVFLWERSHQTLKPRLLLKANSILIDKGHDCLVSLGLMCSTLCRISSSRFCSTLPKQHYYSILFLWSVCRFELAVHNHPIVWLLFIFVYFLLILLSDSWLFILLDFNESNRCRVPANINLLVMLSLSSEQLQYDVSAESHKLQHSWLQLQIMSY